jgi:UDP-glucose 4-epimerase
LGKYFVGVDDVYHLAANADVRNGWDDPLRDFEENLVKTLNIARLSTDCNVENLIFSSTGSIYGDASVFPTPENYSVHHQTSLYGASKYSCESFLGAYAEANKFKVTVLRFVSVLGPRYTHGHVYDFIKKLINDPTKLVVLGNGNQTKSYMHVSDCVDAITTLRGPTDFEVFNVGQKDTLSVHRSIEIITSILNVTPELHFESSNRGWIGDSPVILLDTQKANTSGWQPKVPIEDALKDTVNWIVQNQWVYN